jgi:hypothetical protein
MANKKTTKREMKVSFEPVLFNDFGRTLFFNKKSVAILNFSSLRRSRQIKPYCEKIETAVNNYDDVLAALKEVYETHKEDANAFQSQRLLAVIKAGRLLDKLKK